MMLMAKKTGFEEAGLEETLKIAKRLAKQNRQTMKLLRY